MDQPAPRIPVATLIVIFGVAVLARLAIQMVRGFYAGPETFEEGVVALGLADGRGYGYEMFGTWQQGFRAPLYPLLLGGLYALLGSGPVVAGLLNLVLGGATAVVTTLVGSRVADRGAAVLAGLLVATHPGLLVYSAKIHDLNLDALLLASAALLVLISLRAPNVRIGAAFGLVVGLLALTRPTALPFMPVAAALVAWGKGVSHAVRWTIAAVLVVSAISGALVARNAVVTGEPTLSTDTGMFLWIGNNRDATGTAQTRDGRPMLAMDPDIVARVQGKDEREQDRVFRDAAVAYVMEDPFRAARAYGGRLIAFWWFSPTVGLEYPTVWLPLYAAYWVLALATASVGGIVLWRGRRRIELFALLGVPIVVGLMQAIFYVEGRHRWGVEALILVLSAVGIVWTVRRMARGQSATTDR